MNPFLITLTYRDDKTVRIHMKEEQIDDFFKKLNAGEVFINKESSVGFWTSVDQLRHIIVQPKPEEEINESNGEDPKCDQPVQEGSEDNQGGDETP